ncbi:heterokaryon incompatibility protein-domain-containing protein [Lasiosphaeria hispida]|uniref:Heterokaryon incompatibility protein-domain-containing protein n=1 Tax=Lasiosphaeria hispida TaxID=260671 RepID=A0AAJ0H4U9_9PEZI|nr:heterokaryon incompatibility protein-domain-containing protein [Lasiosphaeria hispida]
MQENAVFASGAPIYSPLNRAIDEIRLLTIKPLSSDRPLECTLEKASLQDIQPYYTSFIASNGFSGKTKRQAKEIWARTPPTRDSSGSRSNPPPAADRFLGSVPALDHHRFLWGDFAALSYVWGDESVREDIILNDQVVSITVNLAVALRTLAADEIFTGRYRLWVDAVCINQVDDSERADQVQKMREIYSGAWAVISWMGRPRPRASINHAFPFIRVLASLESDQRDLENLELGVGEPSKGTYLYALNRMMKQEYWFRLWIIQELVMGASSIVLRYGDEIIDWSTLCKGLGTLYHGYNWQFKDRALKAELRSRGISHGKWQTYSIHLVHFDLRQMTRSDEEGDRCLGFRRLLDIANSADCRDVRDKVFALVGMMSPAIAADIMKAYEFEPPRLFAAVSQAFIVHTASLEPLRQGNPWGDVGAPSWAADWTWQGRIRFSRPEYNLVAPHWDASDPETDPALIYRAHGGTPASYRFLHDWRLLQCEGFVFDEVAGLGAPEAGFFTWDEKRVIQCPSWRSAYGSPELTSKALWNTLLLSIMDKGQKGYYKWGHWRDANNHLLLGDRLLGSFFTNTIPRDAEEITYIEVFCSSQRAIQQRRFMLTKGGYFGWGPDNAFCRDQSIELRIGDKIAIVFGCSTPLVIRPKENHRKVTPRTLIVKHGADPDYIDTLSGREGHGNRGPALRRHYSKYPYGLLIERAGGAAMGYGTPTMLNLILQLLPIEQARERKRPRRYIPRDA